MNVRIGLVVLSLALSVLLGTLLARRGNETPAVVKGKVLLGLSMDTLKEARWQVDRDLFVKRARELGAEVLVQSANGDDVQQVKDVDFLITRQVNALVIIPHNGAAMAKGVEMAHQAGIPVIAYDRLITDCPLDLYVTFDNVRVGELQARYLVDHLPRGKGRIVRIYGSKTDHNALLFKEGQDRVLKPRIARGEIQVLHEDWAEDWKPENAKKIMNAAITKSGQGQRFDCQGALASNDGTAGGVIQALLEEGLAGRLLVTGQDADLVACQRIAQGTQAMTIYKPIKALAPRAAELAVALATGKPIIANAGIFNGNRDVPSVLLEVVAVDRDNLEATVIRDGFHRREEIFRGVARPPIPP
ncbi:MAG: substrate-binding domain-containing protein [Verrucomicrobiae bacterium]|nr:substrate-binding domain-containing protein [Verrucomicrobiae bacterium]